MCFRESQLHEGERGRREGGKGKQVGGQNAQLMCCGLQNTWLSACVHILDPMWGISFNMGLQYYGVILDKSLLLHVLESHEVTVPPVILPGTEAVVDVCSENRESTTNHWSFYNTTCTIICLRKVIHVMYIKHINF